METNQMNSAENGAKIPPMPPVNTTQSGGGSPMGPIMIIAFIILAVAAVGYFVMIGRSMDNNAAPTVAIDNTTTGNGAESSTSTDPAAAALAQQGTNDDVASIDKDLSATDLSSLGDPNTVQ